MEKKQEIEFLFLLNWKYIQMSPCWLMEGWGEDSLRFTFIGNFGYQ